MQVIPQEKDMGQKFVAELTHKIQTKTAKIGIIGLGYVGLPHAIYYARNGYPVRGIDISEDRVQQLLDGKSYVDDISDEEVQLFTAVNQVTASYQNLDELDILLIDVPTPIDGYFQPDMRALAQAAQQVVKKARAGQLIVLESTSYPTTTQDYLVKPLQDEGWAIGEELFVAFSPERVDPGNQTYTIANTPKVVGGYSENCTALAQAFIGKNAVTVGSLEAAELSKLYENTFRFVNIGLADELSKICDSLNIDTTEVLDAAATKPFGFMKFHPAVKIGGHCIGVDPYYLKWFMNSQELETPMINAASTIDQSMTGFTVEKLVTILSEHKVPLFESKIAILGVTYKKNIADLRLSAAPELVSKLRKYGVEVTLYDPYVSSMTIEGRTEMVRNLDYEALATQDMVLILTDHDVVDYDQVTENAKILVDTKAVTSNKHESARYGI